MSRRLHIFNPDTDFALAAKSDFYTPPSKVEELCRRQALFPVEYASSGDAILILPGREGVLSEKKEAVEACRRRNVEIVVANHEAFQRDWSDYQAFPWGWNRVIRRFLEDKMPSLNGIPSEEEVAGIKKLSHRRTTIEFHKRSIYMHKVGIEPPEEYFTIEKAMMMYEQHGDIFFKAPWSSSGRGIIRTLELEPRHVEPWVRGIISKQGSVLGEIALPKRLDCATEWYSTESGVVFSGFSVFTASRRGKYHGNINASQDELATIIRNASPDFGDNILEEQRNILNQLIAPYYRGPLGIDMLITEDGRINLCIEINLRMTMGLCRIFKK